MRNVLPLLLFLLLSLTARSQDEYAQRKFQFLAYEKVPAWTGVAAQWDKTMPVMHLYNSAVYKGHADFVSQGLKTGITFKQFKEQVNRFATRKYLPFFLFDLRTKPVTLEGKNFTWALMLEDYAYEDNGAQMEQTVLRLMQEMQKFIGKAGAAPGNGLLIVNKPVNAISAGLRQQGVKLFTIGELTQHFGPVKTQVLNAGTAYGYLRYVSARETDSAQLTPQDIVVYEKLPVRVPPVSGIVTLEPQTPLSHINLLAKNRGTINLYTSGVKDIPGLEQYKNKLVKIVCSEKKIMVSEAGLAEAQKFWSGKLAKLNIPPAQLIEKNIIDLGSKDGGMLTVNVIGAKAANYALIQKSFPLYVRPGYAIPFYWYFATVKKCGADTLIQKLVRTKNRLSRGEKEQHLKNIREKILQCRLDTGLLLQVKRLADERFTGSRIRLRSSTNCEDLPEFNGAGLYVSKGYNVNDSLHRLEKKILQVYASLWSVAAFQEREFYFIDHGKAAMAILVNEAYREEYANGVVLTIPQKTGYSVFINTQAGDALVTNPGSGQVPEAVLFKQPGDTVYVVESRSNLKDIFAAQEMKALLLELKTLSLEVQKVFDARQVPAERKKYGVDIEFRVMKAGEKYKLYIKQARLLRQVLPQ